VELRQLLKEAIALGASDLHCTLGAVPMVRVDGGLVRHPNLLTPVDQSLLHSLQCLARDRDRSSLASLKDVDFAFELEELGRFRCNVFLQSTGWSVALRILREHIPNLADLGLPPIVSTLTGLSGGLVLIAGPTGSGKSTTLAAMIHQINCEKGVHIITIEDPIEYRHSSLHALVHQREVNTHSESFAVALRGALRQDPDVIMVGELRDRETVSLALTAAETGHLVLGTIHAMSAPKTIDRIVDVFPAEQQLQVRSMLAESLQAVVTQKLIPVRGGRMLAAEVLIATSAVRNLIREGKTHQLPGVMQVSRSAGMQTMETHIRELGVNTEVQRGSRAAFPS
jgi:twitching motility protein PilT